MYIAASLPPNLFKFYQEFMQIKRMGWSEYLDEFDNKNDMF